MDHPVDMFTFLNLIKRIRKNQQRIKYIESIKRAIKSINSLTIIIRLLYKYDTRNYD